MAKVCHECEGRGYTLNNVGDSDGDKLDFIYACIVCRVYSSDALAAFLVSTASGRELRWAIPTGEKVYRPYLA